MYDNIGGKIKGLAKAVFIIEAITAVIMGFVLIATDVDMIPFGLLVMIVGSLVAWVSSWLLYGFGQLIDKVCEIATNTRFSQNTLTSSNNQEHQEQIENREQIASTFKSAGIMDIPKRNK